jgi:hypothetical protein
MANTCFRLTRKAELLTPLRAAANSAPRVTADMGALVKEFHRRQNDIVEPELLRLRAHDEVVRRVEGLFIDRFLH